MPNLTKRIIDALAPVRKDTFVWDDEVRGFGVKMTPTGRKIFILQYRMAGRGAPHRYTIGTYGSLTPVQARHLAADLKYQISKGVDPREIKAKKAENIERAADPATTVGGLIDAFAVKHLAGLRSGKDVKRLLDREVRPILGSKEVTRISRRDIVDLLDGIEDRAGPYARNHATAAIRSMFNWATGRNPDWPNPATRLSMNQITERDRILSDGEIKEIWQGSEQLISIFCPFMRVLLLTAQRRNEVAGMTWDELGDLNKATWTIPAARTKNKLTQEVPLSGMVTRILEQVPRLGSHVFTSDGVTSISGFSKFKHSLDNATLDLRRKQRVETQTNDGKIEGMSPWTLHDLRRTAATIMAKNGVPPHVVERMLNHVSGTISGVAKIYNRYEYWDERREAAESLSDYVEKIVGTRR